MKKIFLLFPVIFLGGCVASDTTGELAVELDKIRKMEGKPIDPPPEFRVFEGYVYSSSNMRSPFMPQIRVSDKPKNVPAGKTVTPDFNRPREPLEDYGIDQLKMVGTIQRPEGPLIALVQDTNTIIHQVRVGSFVGKNHGKVLGLNETKIELLELVPNGRDSWVERSRTMWLEE